MGVPDKVAVPSPLSTKVTPVGRLPAVINAGNGPPVAITSNVPNWSTVKMALLPLVMAGACRARTTLLAVLVGFSIRSGRSATAILGPDRRCSSVTRNWLGSCWVASSVNSATTKKVAGVPSST